MASSVYFTPYMLTSSAELARGLCQEMTQAKLTLAVLGLKNVWPMRQALRGD